MTKEELEKEAEEYLRELKIAGITMYNHCDVERAYIHSAEPREKRITDLEVTNKNISNECHKLVDSLEKKQNEVAELKEKLIKTKEIIADFESRVHYRKVYIGNITELMNRAEQLLMELHV